jgi:hypothetical protein
VVRRSDATDAVDQPSYVGERAFPIAERRGRIARAVQVTWDERAKGVWQVAPPPE